VDAAELAELLKNLKAGVGALGTAADLLKTTVKTIQNAKPNYPKAAENFRQISVILEQYTDNVLKFLRPYRAFTFTGPESVAAYAPLLAAIADEKLAKIAYDFHFNCRRIEGLYKEECRDWLQALVAKHIEPEKAEAADKALEKLSRYDAELVKVVTDQVLKPLKVHADEVNNWAVKGVFPKAQSVQAMYVKQTEPLFTILQHNLDQLKKEVVAFEALARS
jgi:formate dehydrogenase maturation protein FdhE